MCVFHGFLKSGKEKNSRDSLESSILKLIISQFKEAYYGGIGNRRNRFYRFSYSG